MTDDEISLAFMNPETAAELLKDNPDMSEAIVAAAVIPEDEVIVVRKDEFLKWLYEDTEKMERDAEDNDEFETDSMQKK